MNEAYSKFAELCKKLAEENAKNPEECFNNGDFLLNSCLIDVKIMMWQDFSQLGNVNKKINALLKKGNKKNRIKQLDDLQKTMNGLTKKIQATDLDLRDAIKIDATPFQLLDQNISDDNNHHYPLVILTYGHSAKEWFMNFG